MSKIDNAEAIRTENAAAGINNAGPKDSPPPVVSIIGPARCGKTTLLSSIVASYFGTRQVAAHVMMRVKNRRYMFYECAADIERAIDAVKASDMIIFVVNLGIGIQRDTLEAISMMHNFGVTKFCFALTNCDYRACKGINEIESKIQREFACPVRFFRMKFCKITELYENVGVVMKHLDLMKYKQTEWRTVHPYIVVDRLKDGVGYGYVRGAGVGSEIDAHIPGFGDITICGIAPHEDPLARGNVLYTSADAQGPVEDEESADSLSLDVRPITLFGGHDERVPMPSPEMYASSPDNFSLQTNIGSHFEMVTEVEFHSTESATDDSSSSITQELVEYTTRSAPEDNVPYADESRWHFNTDLPDETEPAVKRRRPNESVEEVEEELEIEPDDPDELVTLSESETEENTVAIPPGTYVRFNLSKGFNLRHLLLIGAYLPTEGCNIFLKGRVIKNRWQPFDLKSNVPHFFSVGWCRFQSVPIFCTDDIFMKSCSDSSEIIFFGPAVPLKTSFFIYSYEADHKIFAGGQVLDTSGKDTLRKKLKLSGIPKNLTGRTVSIHNMFSTYHEAMKFTSAQVKTGSGLRGIIKNPIGRCGEVKAVFEANILPTDFVYLRCLSPIKAQRYLRHTVTGHYLHRVETVPEEPSTSSEDDSDSSDDSPAVMQRIVERRRPEREVQELERQMPFHCRRVRAVQYRIELPTPPGTTFGMSRSEVQRMREEEDRIMEAERKRRNEMFKKAREEILRDQRKPYNRRHHKMRHMRSRRYP